VLDACREGGVDVLPVKGILTAYQLYADPGERPIQDVDLRVRPRDLNRVRDIGHRAGWRLVHRSRAYCTLSFDVLGFLVEFETHVGPPGLCGLSVEAMLRRATRRAEGLCFPHLEPELHDHVLVMCVNAFKDKLVDAPAGALRDLELLPDRADFSPERLVDVARDTGTATILWIVARWLAGVREVTAWDRIGVALGPSAPRPLYAALLERALQTHPPRRVWLRLLARGGADRGRQRLQAFRSMALRAVEDAMARSSPANGPMPPRTESQAHRLSSALPTSSHR
jgi:hypothetical protein